MTAGNPVNHWKNTLELKPCDWVCGYCGNQVGGKIGYRRLMERPEKVVYICPRCDNPTAFIEDEDAAIEQIPAPVSGNDVEHLPKSVKSLYDEIRRCIQYSSYTSAVLSMRKLLMHVAVEQGAKPGETFVAYLDYLRDNGWISPKCAPWVDAIRKTGNEASHEIVFVPEEQAVELLGFCEMVLKLVYEFPARMGG